MFSSCSINTRIGSNTSVFFFGGGGREEENVVTRTRYYWKQMCKTSATAKNKNRLRTNGTGNENPPVHNYTRSGNVMPCKNVFFLSILVKNRKEKKKILIPVIGTPSSLILEEKNKNGRCSIIQYDHVLSSLLNYCIFIEILLASKNHKINFQNSNFE